MSTRQSILVVSQYKEVFKEIQSSLSSFYNFFHATSKDLSLEMIKKRHCDFIFIDIEILKDSMEDGYKSSLQPFWIVSPNIEIIVMTSQEMIREALMAVKAGADNYIKYPVNSDTLKYIIESTYDSVIKQSELDYLRDQFWREDSLELLQTNSPLMKEVYDKIQSVSQTKSTVLLIGETGTGKGVLAKLLHRLSDRKDAKFINVHCGSIPDTLIESDLFGHEKGSFTGAVRRKLGKFEIAHEGTIFLDEIGTITPAPQIKLLKVLQDSSFQRVGGEETIHTDVRIIAATNADLKEMCDDGQFRSDLYYRLNVFPIKVPPLRERKEDIPLFVEIFLKKLNRFHYKKINDIHPSITKAFQNYLWPGNIRELENLMERAHILETSPLLTPDNFPKELFISTDHIEQKNIDISQPLAEVRRNFINDVEVNYLKELLSANKGSIKHTAERAGITPRHLHELMKKHGLKKEHFKT